MSAAERESVIIRTNAAPGGLASVDSQVYAQALACARGSYQKSLVQGYVRLSGTDLRGKAARWGASYARSRAALVRRLLAAGLAVGERTGPDHIRILLIGRKRRPKRDPLKVALAVARRRPRVRYPLMVVTAETVR